jgi:hypothetical protein
MSHLSCPGELHIDLDSDSGMGLVVGVQYPLAYPVFVDRLIKSDAVGDPSSQID